MVLTKSISTDIIIKHLAELCKGSTTDSDSVCLGSNPSSATMQMQQPMLLHFFRGIAQLVACLVRDQEAGSSSLPTPTNNNRRF